MAGPNLFERFLPGARFGGDFDIRSPRKDLFNPFPDDTVIIRYQDLDHLSTSV
jgi:hypothetical protein